VSPHRSIAAVAAAVALLAGCGVQPQRSPQPIELPTQESATTPSFDRSPSPSSTALTTEPPTTSGTTTPTTPAPAPPLPSTADHQAREPAR